MPERTSIRQKNQSSGKKQQQRRPGYRQLFQGMPYHLYQNLSKAKGGSPDSDLKKTSQEVSQLYREIFR